MIDISEHGYIKYDGLTYDEHCAVYDTIMRSEEILHMLSHCNKETDGHNGYCITCTFYGDYVPYWNGDYYDLDLEIYEV